MFNSISRRLMLAFAAFTLGLSLWFGLLVMAAAYTVEDSFFYRELRAEAKRLDDAHAASGKWAAPAKPWMSLHEAASTLPKDILDARQAEPHRREFTGQAGRHYHLHELRRGAAYPVLLAEVSQQLVVRPVRNELLAWLGAWVLATFVAALVLAAWLARRLSQPLQSLAAAVEKLEPQHLSGALPLPHTQRADEVGTLARTLGALAQRVQAFAQREQRFTRDASHELRTPLAVMRMSLEPVVSGAAAALSARDAESLYSNVLLMQDAAAMLLMLARNEREAASQDASAEVLPLVEQWVLAHEAWLSRKGLSVVCKLQSREGPRWPLPKAVAQTLLSNLLNNAVQHGSCASPITIDLEQGHVRVTNACVANPAAASGGTGMGFSIVERLLQAYAGKLEFMRTEAQARVKLVFA